MTPSCSFEEGLADARSFQKTEEQNITEEEYSYCQEG